MSARLPSRWPSAAALLAAGVLTSAAVAQSPDPLADPPIRRTPQTAPAPAPAQFLPARLYVEPLLLEEEQVSEHGDRPHAAPPIMPAPPRVFRSCGLPECDRDDGKMAPEEVTLRCLLFSINPLAAFLPLPVEVQTETLPSPNYLQHPPQYVPPSPAFPQASAKQVPELVVMPQEVERLQVMPTEVERLDVMPVEEESEPHYELLAPWIDYTRLFKLPTWPLADIQVSVQETQTGSLFFGAGAEVSRTGTVTFTTAPLPETKEVKAPQVQLNLLVAEVKGKAARKLNLDRHADGKAPSWVIEVADESRQKALEAGLSGLREKGRAKVLAEPRLVTLSGQQASFLSGGEQAIPVTTGQGQAGVRFEEFGTRVTCQPVVLPDGTIRLEVEPEISELCDVAGGTVQGVLVPGRSSQRVHTTADVPPGHTLVITGPKAGGDSRLVIFVTPTVVEPPAATGATPGLIPQMIFDFGNAVRGCLDLFGLSGIGDEPSHPMPERVLGGIADDDEESVHDLLVKCQRELSRGHHASAEDLAQQAIERDRKQVAADPLVRESDLLQRVKAIASLPLGTVDPCVAKGGGGIVPAGAAKAIGSDERIVEALMQEFNTAYQQGQYREAEVLAESARKLDPDNAGVVAALKMAALQMSLPQHAGPIGRTVATLTVQSRNDFKEGRYEEARNAALQALSVAPGDPTALALVHLAAEALARRPRPEPVPQCTYVGTNVRPILPPVDPAVVGALQKILIEGDKGGPFGGTEEAEPKDDGSKPAPRR